MSMKLMEQIIEATVAGDPERCVSLARQVVAEGADPLQAIEEGFSRGMSIVGEKFARMEYYLPELIRSADAMKAAVEVLRPHLGRGREASGRGSIVLGTIQGDLHDLGKNIVRTMLEAAGFTVHDLGCNVPVRQFVDQAEERRADIIAASAILTTTMAYMPDLVKLVGETGERGRFKIMLGGAPVTPEFAAKAGADGYGENAAQAVDVAKNLMQAKKEGR
jgi:corrinoid protein of di/trimethylamine methyltransferase